MNATDSRVSTAVKLLVFTVACILGAGWLVIQLGNIEPFAEKRTYEAELPDAGGLLVNDAVKIAGVDVGKVTSLRLERGRAIATFTVDADEELGRDTQVGVRWRNLLGLRYLYVYPSGDGELEEGYRFPVDAVRAPTDLSVFLRRVTPVMRALDPEVGNVVVQALSEALSGREQEVRDLVAEAGSFLDTVADHDEQVGRVLDNGARVVDAYAQREQQLRQLLDRFADVSTTVADRNDELIAAIQRIGDVEAELRRLVEVNEGDIRGSIEALDTISAILSVNHDAVEDLVTYTSTGIVQYHRISRWGQWFNIRVPGLSKGEETIETERGAALPPRGERGDTTGSSGAVGFLRAGMTGTRVRAP